MNTLLIVVQVLGMLAAGAGVCWFFYLVGEGR